MSIPNPIEYIDDLVHYIANNYRMTGAWRVQRHEEISDIPHCRRRLVHLRRDGAEQPGADVLVGLAPVSAPVAPAGVYIYLWDDQLWNSPSDALSWQTASGVLLLTYMVGLG